MRIQLLTNEEKEFAEKNHYIVDRFLSYNHLVESDYYDVIIFGYLHAVQAYLRTPELAKYQFSTIAQRKMKDCLINEYISQNRSKRKAPMADYHENYETATLDEFLPNRMSCMAETLDNQNQLYKLLSHITPKEKKVIFMKADGYSHQEIAESCDITIHGVSSRLTRMRHRLRMLSLI